MKQIVFGLSEESGRKVITIRFPYDNVLVDIIRRIPGTCWNNVKTCWYIEYTDDIIGSLERAYSGMDDVTIIKKLVQEEVSETEHTSLESGSSHKPGPDQKGYPEKIEKELSNIFSKKEVSAILNSQKNRSTRRC